MKWINRIVYIFLIVFTLILSISCKTHPDAGRRYDANNPDKIYKLRLSPLTGTRYHYLVTNESELKMEVEGKKMDNLNKSTVEASYSIDRDTLGNFLLSMVYEKIHLHTKNNEEETDMDSDSSSTSIDRIEQTLGALKGASIEAVVSPTGQTKSIKGYEELKRNAMSHMSVTDTYSRSIAEKQWDLKIKDGLIRKNMEQFFNIFPDSAVHVGDRWKIGSTQSEQIKMKVNNSFLLKEIHDGIAIITSKGDISADSAAGSTMGYEYTADLKGEQDGEYQVDMASGMLVSSKIEADVEGKMTMMGREVPLSIHTSVQLEGKKVK